MNVTLPFAKVGVPSRHGATPLTSEHCGSRPRYSGADLSPMTRAATGTSSAALVTFPPDRALRRVSKFAWAFEEYAIAANGSRDWKQTW